MLGNEYGSLYLYFFTVYVTGSDLEKSFVFKKTVEITSRVRLTVYV